MDETPVISAVRNAVRSLSGGISCEIQFDGLVMDDGVTPLFCHTRCRKVTHHLWPRKYWRLWSRNPVVVSLRTPNKASTSKD